MSYSVLNDLAEAMKALDGKKSSCGAGTWQPPTDLAAAHKQIPLSDKAYDYEMDK